MFAALPEARHDPILAIMEAFAEDPRPGKTDLGVGVYRDADGRTPVMRAVRAAEERLWRRQETKAYVGLAGDPAFLDAVRRLVLGDGPADGVAAAATPGGTGAVRQALELVRLARPAATAWISAPSWPNHAALIDAVGLARRDYRYRDPASGGLDRAGMMADLGGVAAGDVVVLHASCHNPTGVDPSPADWARIAALLAARGAVPLIDAAYLGFGAAPEADAAGLRAVVAAVPEALVTFTGSKSFGMYRERVGAVLAVGAPADRARVAGTLAWLNRQTFAFPPDHGARVATTILGDATLRTDWQDELAVMRGRIAGMRTALVAALQAETGTDRFGFLTRHRGMFSLIGASAAQVTELRAGHGVYLIPDGRMNLAALTEATIPRVARALATVLR